MSETPSTPETGSDPIEAWVRAVESRDSRFDGWVIVGVRTTGIYCRPSCPTPVRPKPENMDFFKTPAAAQTAGFRACKRCAPDSVPGSPEWNRRDDLVARAVRAIEDGEVDRSGVSGLASLLSVSSRHLNRIMSAGVGATPIRLARARRARLARYLLLSTDLPVSQIVFASGFESIRQFNQTIRETFDQTPTQIRGRGGSTSSGDWIEVPLAYRPPLEFGVLLGWLKSHSVGGIEEVDGGVYRRSMLLAGGPAVFEVVDDPSRSALKGRFRLASLADLPVAINRVRRLLDLDADPVVINLTLGVDPYLGALVAQRPGIRVPGAVDGSESLFKTILHQQVSLASAVGSAERLVREHGDRLENPVGGVTHTFPLARTLSALDPSELALPRSRAGALVAAAASIEAGDLVLSPYGTDREAVSTDLVSIKGIGPWTAALVALRGLGDPDVVCTGDLALATAAERIGIDGNAELVAAAESWRPWRSYAMQHLWAEYAEGVRE